MFTIAALCFLAAIAVSVLVTKRAIIEVHDASVAMAYLYAGGKPEPSALERMFRRLFIARARVAAAVLASLSLIGTGAWATYSGFGGNGRGGLSAVRPTCNDPNRGRVWAGYDGSRGTTNDGTKSDILEVCTYNSAGTYTWKWLYVSYQTAP